MPIIKKRDVEIMEQLSGEELERHLLKLPAKKEKFDELFDYLEAKLSVRSCDHTSRLTMQFLMQNMMDLGKVSGWLSQNGGYCDCKIVEEIAVPWRKLFNDREV
ncbi:MAG: DUF2695 domain-containing protein [Pyrinomonadaceae bacterium]